MTITTEFLLRTILIGAGATLVMDIWLLLLKRLGIPGLNFALLGRWVGHLPKGRWKHESIAKSPAIAHELLLGWLAHYGIGIAFAALLVAMAGVDWTRAPSLWPALFTGMATVVAPLFVMQPAMGAGIASSRTPTPWRNRIRSFFNHSVFGLGLYLAALASAALF